MAIESIELKDIKATAYLSEGAGFVSSKFETEFTKLLAQGRSFAVAPAGTDANRLMDFEHGGLTPKGEVTYQRDLRLTRVVNLDDDFAGELQTYLKCWPGSAAVGFDCSSDTKVTTDSIDLMHEPFGILAASDPSVSELEAFVRGFSTAWKTIAMVVQKPSEVTSITELAARIRLFAVSAYDGESYVYWIRS
jgi:hypothetical protein